MPKLPIVSGADVVQTLERLVMCQHYSGHKVKQLYAANRSLLATDNHWLNAVALCCKRPQYIRI